MSNASSGWIPTLAYAKLVYKYYLILSPKLFCEVDATIALILQVREVMPGEVINGLLEITELARDHRAYVCCFHVHIYTNIHLHKYICMQRCTCINIQIKTCVHTHRHSLKENVQQRTSDWVLWLLIRTKAWIPSFLLLEASSRCLL